MTPPNVFNELLEATISKLESLREQGQRYVAVSPEILKELSAARGPVKAPVAHVARPSFSATAQARPQSQQFAPATNPARVVAAAAPQAPVRKPEPDIILATDTGKAAGIAELRERALVCQKCPNLAAARKNVVFGVGSIDAELMFVGEAPGADEDEQGEPFVGKAGQLLTRIIQTMGFSREQVYIANILKCRPDTPGQSFGNRPPTPEEMERCIPYLRAQIDLIKPKVMVALGATAVEGLFGKVPGIGITKLRGRWKEFRGIAVMPTYHPSYLLRPNPNNIKREAWEDMLQVMERLGMQISEKQRGYFLNKTA
jgi:uracil-DNA glycosylase family 4